jgi:hypothetical protein
MLDRERFFSGGASGPEYGTHSSEKTEIPRNRVASGWLGDDNGKAIPRHLKC